MKPVPQCFAKLKQAVAGFPGLQAENGVVSDDCGAVGATVPFHAPSEEFFAVETAAAHHQLWQLGSMKEAAFKKSFWYNYSKYHHVYEVSCNSVEKLVRRSLGVLEATAALPKPALHFALTDVQCVDYSIVRAQLGFMSALVLQYEDECYTRAEIEAMRLLLNQQGYLYLDDGVNTVAVLLANATYTNASVAALQGTVATMPCARSAKLCT